MLFEPKSIKLVLLWYMYVFRASFPEKAKIEKA